MKSKSMRVFIVAVTLMVVMVCMRTFFNHRGTAAPVPYLLNYQGRLTDKATGSPVPDGPNTITFRIWDQPTGGTMLWTGSYTRETKKGMFNVILGSGDYPIDPAKCPFDKNYWLEVEYKGEVFPRTQMVTAPYAVIAERTEKPAFADTGFVHGTEYFIESKDPVEILSTTIQTKGSSVLLISYTLVVNPRGEIARLRIYVDEQPIEPLFEYLGSTESRNATLMVPVGPGTHKVKLSGFTFSGSKFCVYSDRLQVCAIGG